MPYRARCSFFRDSHNANAGTRFLSALSRSTHAQLLGMRYTQHANKAQPGRFADKHNLIA